MNIPAGKTAMANITLSPVAFEFYDAQLWENGGSGR